VQDVIVKQCNYWYFPIVLPVMALLVQSLDTHSQESQSSVASLDVILNEILALCDCSSEVDKASWVAASKANIVSISALYQQNVMRKQPPAPIQNDYFSVCFFELLADSVMIAIRQSFASLQHVLAEGSVWMSYNCLYYQLSTVASLVVHCITPLSKNILASEAQSTSDVKRVVHTTRGVNMLVRACCAPPPALLNNKAVLQLNQCPDQALHTVLNIRPPVRTSCSCAIPAFQFSHILHSFQELFNVTVGMLDMHAAAITAVPAGSQVELHFEGLIECLNSMIKIVK
jgi:hypothetical protein